MLIVLPAKFVLFLLVDYDKFSHFAGVLKPDFNADSLFLQRNSFL